MLIFVNDSLLAFLASSSFKISSLRAIYSCFLASFQPWPPYINIRSNCSNVIVLEGDSFVTSNEASSGPDKFAVNSSFSFLKYITWQGKSTLIHGWLGELVIASNKAEGLTDAMEPITEGIRPKGVFDVWPVKGLYVCTLLIHLWIY